ncbi:MULTISPECIES: MBOAT family protein [unclassified Exiguobacterium]|uniref:MBOAT family O-acyltransferase n=1 Tax=unclassified Exiguobacterium TaxID=2644629 RepID=UPI00103EA832|nr:MULTISPECIES: MBOAT family protein [unclassified Exiguobacterium]TCI70205.1 MBOAT family protein [Exiguobacterium sp. IPCI3]TCI79236.1 MBOAT family protein [Exiguobacterium sp. IPCH1]TCI81712.1 MBOAT family protein [Exiguobacterium sp. IPBC4]
MLFSSTVFLFYFLPIVLGLYFISPRPIKNTILLVASLFFYAWGEPRFVLIMLASIAMNYVFGLLVDRDRHHEKKIKLWMTLMVLGNLGMLGVFKYASFFVENVNSVLGFSLNDPEIPLPLGISFFTFQAMSYVIDVYRKDGQVQRNIFDLALYVSFFPQLIAGPIVRYQTVADEIVDRRETIDDFVSGIQRFVIGLGKKMILANSAGYVADQIFGMPAGEMSTTLAWIGIIAYSLQIYFDFSGYSDMAIGLGRMFGFHFLENFNYPYISRSVSEFWRRWHMSLGSWFRDYVYIPLGGNRQGEWKTYRNLAVVWFLTGIWHGASWTFIAWGVYYGVFIMLERAFLGKWLKAMPSWLSLSFTLFVVIIGWVFFRADDFPYAIAYLQTMFGLHGGPLFDQQALYYLVQYGVVLLIAIIAATPIPRIIVGKFLSQELDDTKTTATRRIVGLVRVSGVLVLFFLSISYIVSSTFNPFIYFRF